MLELTNLKSNNPAFEQSEDLSFKTQQDIIGGAIGLPALGAAASSTGAFNDVPSLPSTRSFLTNTAFGAALGAAGVIGTVASGGSLGLLQAGLSLEG
jgi:hypothetical protein